MIRRAASKSFVAPVSVVVFLLAGCLSAPPPPAPVSTTPPPEATPDPHSYSRPADAIVKHVSVDLAVDFAQKRLHGTATLTFENRTGTDHLILDVRDLTIKTVTLDSGETTTYRVGESKPFMGSPLTIDIRPATKTVTIAYETSPSAGALQWLGPSQTAGKRHPYLFTQSQAILVRSWIPMQDSPGVRITYDATIRVPPELMAVMSAESLDEKNTAGVYRFRMTNPIPPYLVALAVGNLVFRPFDSRSGVYSEPEVVERAAYEFADTPKMIAAAEKLYGPYRWGRYDLIVLPPSFPYGGMENPRLTFVTPTTLAGDRSLVSLVAHELAHSWSGNLVTNSTWHDVWLNEGFTTYFENRIMEEVYGDDYAEMIRTLSRQDLQEEVELLGEGSPDIALHVDMTGRNPDEGSGEIPYSKGMFLLRLLEESVGRARWDRSLRGYFDTYAFKPMDSGSFVRYLRSHLLDEYPGLEAKLRLAEWIDGRVIPANIPTTHSKRFDQVDAQIAAFNAGAKPETLETRHWTTHEWLRFVRNLGENPGTEKLVSLDRAFRFSTTGNSEVLFAWLMIAVKEQYTPAYPSIESFLTSMGRRKFLKPLYTEMAKTPEGKEMAMRIYRKARSSYHFVSTETIDGVLGWSE